MTDDTGPARSKTPFLIAVVLLLAATAAVLLTVAVATFTLANPMPPIAWGLGGDIAAVISFILLRTARRNGASSYFGSVETSSQEPEAQP
jgi:hypothetical protein